jgi:hypothetical protein
MVVVFVLKKCDKRKKMDAEQAQGELIVSIIKQ